MWSFIAICVMFRLSKSENYVIKILGRMYSVTQSYVNSFWGDVVLDSGTFNNVSKD